MATYTYTIGAQIIGNMEDTPTVTNGEYFVISAENSTEIDVENGTAGLVNYGDAITSADALYQGFVDGLCLEDATAISEALAANKTAIPLILTDGDNYVFQNNSGEALMVPDGTINLATVEEVSGGDDSSDDSTDSSTTYNSDYDVRLAELDKLGGDVTVHYNSVYDIDLAILDKIGGQGGGVTEEKVQEMINAGADIIVLENGATMTQEVFDALADLAGDSAKWSKRVYFKVNGNYWPCITYSGGSAVFYYFDGTPYHAYYANSIGVGDTITISKLALATQTWVTNQEYAKVNRLTQAEYDALETKDDNTIYIITDAE